MPRKINRTVQYRPCLKTVRDLALTRLIFCAEGLRRPLEILAVDKTKTAPIQDAAERTIAALDEYLLTF